MFASAEEVTKTGPREEEEAPKDDEPKEAPEAKVSCLNRLMSLDCAADALRQQCFLSAVSSIPSSGVSWPMSKSGSVTCFSKEEWRYVAILD